MCYDIQFLIDQKIIIEAKNHNGGSEVIEVKPEVQDGKKSPTLATALVKHHKIEAISGEQLSCSTCVGEVESNNLTAPSEDENDLLDSVPTSPSKFLRATCQIPLKFGKYKYSNLTHDKAAIPADGLDRN